MAEAAPIRSGDKRVRSHGEDSDYDRWFTMTPDPWAELAKLEHGADRTFGSTVQSVVINAEPAQRPALEQRLLDVLQKPECTAAGRQFIARLLALIGSAKSVAVLGTWLKNPDAADVARYALDGIADPSVDAPYREALGVLSGAPKIGLIGSIALRGDSAATGLLTKIQENPSEQAEVRAAAGRAAARLAKVANAQ